jgi:AraC-like DNA-binding protein
LTPTEPFAIRHTRGDDASQSFHDRHYALEVGVVIGGEITREWPGTSATLGPGGVWLCGMWEPHGYVVSRPPFETVAVLIHPEHVARAGEGELNLFRLFTAPADLRSTLDALARREARRVAVRLARLPHRPSSPLRRAWCAAWVRELMLLCVGAEQAASSSGAGRVEEDYLRIQPALELVFTHRRFVPARQAARACNMGRSRFDQVFREVMDEPFAPFALRHRVHGAAHQLATTDDPIKAVAIQWGFADSSHLHAAITRRFSMTPGEYRRRHGRSCRSDRPGST